MRLAMSRGDCATTTKFMVSRLNLGLGKRQPVRFHINTIEQFTLVFCQLEILCMQQK